MNGRKPGEPISGAPTASALAARDKTGDFDAPVTLAVVPRMSTYLNPMEEEVLPFEVNGDAFEWTFEEKVLGMQLAQASDGVGVEVRAAFSAFSPTALTFSRLLGPSVVAVYSAPCCFPNSERARRVCMQVAAFSELEGGVPLPAEACGQVNVGDRITAVGKRSTQGAPCDEVLEWIIAADRPVTIHFERKLASRTARRGSVRVKHESAAPAAEVE